MEPSKQRIAEYELKFKELMNGGGHMMDFTALGKEYKDVIDFKYQPTNNGQHYQTQKSTKQE